MIIRHIPTKPGRKSSFKALVTYLTHTKNKQERVGAIEISNCQSDTLAWVIPEVLATQAQNTRAIGDKVYHLLISFREGDNPASETLNAIEAQVCAAIGLGEHQRVSVVHHDTDNLHIHVAINKIHPETFTLHEPYLAYKQFNKIAPILESHFQLQPDNHVARKTHSQNKADDFEHHTGIESLIHWIKNNCLDALIEARTWDELHETLAQHNLAIHLKGAGFVIKNGVGLSIKASSVSRDCSKARLEERLGVFVPAKRTFSGSAPVKTPLSNKKPRLPSARHNRFTTLNSVSHLTFNPHGYIFKPKATGIDTNALFARFKQAMNQNALERKQTLPKYLAHKQKAIEAAKAKARVKRQAIKHYTQGSLNKKVLYRLVSKTLKAEINDINRDYQGKRNALMARTERCSWADWLQKQASKGNTPALEALQARKTMQDPPSVLHLTIMPSAAYAQNLPIQIPDSITKKGTVIYAHEATAIRDDGQRLSISRGLNAQGIQAALELALQRYGAQLSIEGDASFKQQVVQVAAHADMDITFQDAHMQSEYQRLHYFLKSQELLYDQRFNRTDDTGRTAPSRNAEFGDSSITQRVSTAGTDDNGREPHGISSTEPNPQAIRTASSTIGSDRMRNVSELCMDEHADRSQMLLPGDVSNNLEHGRTQSNNRMRRNLRELELTNQGTLSLIGQSCIFIKLECSPAEDIAYFKAGDKVLRLSIKPENLNQLKCLKIGDKVVVLPDGKIKSFKAIKR